MKKIIFETKEQYLEMIQAWKATCKDKDFQFEAMHYALYAIIRDKDPAKCFAKPEQQSKSKLIGQGKIGNETFKYTIKKIGNPRLDEKLMKPFGGKLTTKHLELMREHLEGESK